METVKERLRLDELRSVAVDRWDFFVQAGKKSSAIQPHLSKQTLQTFMPMAMKVFCAVLICMVNRIFKEL